MLGLQGAEGWGSARQSQPPEVQRSKRWPLLKHTNWWDGRRALGTNRGTVRLPRPLEKKNTKIRETPVSVPVLGNK